MAPIAFDAASESGRTRPRGPKAHRKASSPHSALTQKRCGAARLGGASDAAVDKTTHDLLAVPGKSDPSRVVDAFVTYLDDALADYLFLRSIPQEFWRVIAVDALLRAAVGFEAFRSDWHIAAIQRDASRYKPLEEVWARYRVAAAANPNPIQRAKAVAFVDSLARNPDMDLVRALADPHGRNLDLSSFDSWRRRARADLAPRFSQRVESLPPEDIGIMEAVVAMRNCIAHRSRSSTDKMNHALKALPGGLARGNQRITFRSLGRYLCGSSGADNVTRCELFYRGLRRIAAALHVKRHQQSPTGA